LAIKSRESLFPEADFSWQQGVLSICSDSSAIHLDKVWQVEKWGDSHQGHKVRKENLWNMKLEFYAKIQPSSLWWFMAKAKAV
jgi:hypothetical protein